MELYYYFLKASLFSFLFLFCKCTNSSKGLDARFIDDWKIEIRKQKKKCNNYIGSKVSTLDKELVVDLIDSISRKKKINIKSLQVSNWRAKQEINYHHGKSPKHLIYYDFSLNEEYFFRIILDKISLEVTIKKLSESKIYYTSYKDINEGDRVIEFSYIKYLFMNNKRKLKNVYVFCQE